MTAFLSALTEEGWWILVLSVAIPASGLLASLLGEVLAGLLTSQSVSARIRRVGDEIDAVGGRHEWTPGELSDEVDRLQRVVFELERELDLIDVCQQPDGLFPELLQRRLLALPIWLRRAVVSHSYRRLGRPIRHLSSLRIHSHDAVSRRAGDLYQSYQAGRRRSPSSTPTAA